jgi:stage II sporulation protein D
VVAATRGTVCQRHQKLFCAYYSAVCGGQTTNGQSVFKDAIDVVRSVPCEWCRDSPHYRWTTALSHDEFHNRAFKNGNRPSEIRSIRQQDGPGGGLISRFEFDDGQRPVSVTGIELRERLPAGTLSSPHFQIKLEQDRVVFEGRGHGHGVGFCQWGAKGQAEAGRNSLDIVRHYYPGTEIAVLNY